MNFKITTKKGSIRSQTPNNNLKEIETTNMFFTNKQQDTCLIPKLETQTTKSALSAGRLPKNISPIGRDETEIIGNVTKRKNSKNRNVSKQKTDQYQNIMQIYGGGSLNSKGMQNIPRPQKKKGLTQISNKQNEKQQQQLEYQKNNISKIQQIQEQIQNEKLQKQQEILKKELQLQKLKKDVNFNYVNSKLYEQTEGQKARLKQKEEEKLLKQQQQQLNTNESQDEEAYKRLFQRQKEYLNKMQNQKLQEKKLKEEQEQKKIELKNKMQNHVLVNIKQQIEDGNFLIDDNNSKKQNQQVEIIINQEDSDENGKNLQTSVGRLSDISKQENNKQNVKIIKRQINSYPFITDLTEWKNKQRIPQETKVFIVSGGYGDVKKALRARGWIENNDRNSQCFDFKWTLLSKEIGYNQLKEGQIVNHFSKVNGITTKVGLCKNLRNLAWCTNMNVDEFYPRCYDLTDQEDFEEFVTDFKISKAESILNKYLLKYKDKQQEDLQDQYLQIIYTSMAICLRKLKELDDIIDDPCEENFKLITDEEWEIISQDELNQEGLIKRKHEKWLSKLDKKNGKPKKKKINKNKKKRELSNKVKKENSNNNENQNILYNNQQNTQNENTKQQDNQKQIQKFEEEEEEEQEENNENEQNLIKEQEEINAELYEFEDEDEDEDENENDQDGEDEEDNQEEGQQYQYEEQEEQEKTDNQHENNQLIQQSYEKDIKQNLYEQIQNIIQSMHKKFVQSPLTKDQNIWILKPASSSRGRGIVCYNSLIEIQDHVKAKEFQWVAQKYIENTLVLKNKRKFDIRIWVLISDWNPLVVWYFQECYIRLSAQDYSTDDLQNKYQHLTNNTISKKNKDQDEIFGSSNMFTQKEFQDYLIEQEGYDVFKEKIQPKMKKAIIWSMQACANSVQQRKNSFEMFGYDFMIDDQYNTWLIEINSSPDMSYSTQVTERLVKMGLQDLIKIVIDYNNAPKKNKKEVNTGSWKRIYKGASVPDKLQTVGLNLMVEGKSIKK